MQGRDKGPLRLNSITSCLPCPVHAKGSPPQPSGPFLLSLAPWKNSVPAPRTVGQEIVQGVPWVPFSSLHLMTGKASLSLQGTGCSRLCDGLAAKWPNSGWACEAFAVCREADGCPGSALPLLKEDEEAPAPTRLPPGAAQATPAHGGPHLSRRYSAHCIAEETKVLTASQIAQGCWTERGTESRPCPPDLESLSWEIERGHSTLVFLFLFNEGKLQNA